MFKLLQKINLTKSIFFVAIVFGIFGLAGRAGATPTVPQGFTAIYINNMATYLSWSASTDTDHGGVAYYNIYRNSVYIMSRTVPYTDYYDYDILFPNTYTYTVSAVDMSGNESARSATVQVVADVVVPSTPPNFTATTISSQHVQLAWNAATDNVEVNSYKIRRDGVQIFHLDNTKSEMADYNVAPSTQYNYTITALDAMGNESAPASAIANTSINVPPAIYAVGNKLVNENANLVFNVTTVDSDGDINTLVASNLPAGATFAITDQFQDWAIGTFSWTPTFSQAGTYPNVVFTSTDMYGGVTTEVISITVINVATDAIPPSAPIGLSVS